MAGRNNTTEVISFYDFSCESKNTITGLAYKQSKHTTCTLGWFWQRQAMDILSSTSPQPGCETLVWSRQLDAGTSSTGAGRPCKREIVNWKCVIETSFQLSQSSSLVLTQTPSPLTTEQQPKHYSNLSLSLQRQMDKQKYIIY